MAFSYMCLLISAGLLQVARPLRLPATVGDGAVRTELSAAPPIRRVVEEHLCPLLNCSIPNSGNYHNFWSRPLFHDGSPPFDISNGTVLLVQDSRYTLIKDPATSSINLQIENLQPSDAGYYQCTVISPDGRRLSHTIHLVVFERWINNKIWEPDWPGKNRTDVYCAGFDFSTLKDPTVSHNSTTPQVPTTV